MVTGLRQRRIDCVTYTVVCLVYGPPAAGLSSTDRPACAMPQGARALGFARSQQVVSAHSGNDPYRLHFVARLRLASLRPGRRFALPRATLQAKPGRTSASPARLRLAVANCVCCASQETPTRYACPLPPGRALVRTSEGQALHPRPTVSREKEYRYHSVE
jgi:hypothetical protein